MLAVVNAISSQEDQEPVPPPTPVSIYENASIPPRTSCPLLAAPYEVRAQILLYLLPCTIPSPEKHIVWLRGNTSMMLVCRQMYEECRGLMYGRNWFLIDIHYDRLIFNYQWLIVTDVSMANYGRNLGPEYKTEPCCHELIPSRKFDFISHFSTETRALMKKFVVRMNLIDSYEGMIKHNISTDRKLRIGLAEKFEEFKQSALFHEKTETPLMELKLLGSKKQIKLFRTDCPELEAKHPGWLSCVSPTNTN